MAENPQYRFLRYAPRDGSNMQLSPTRWERMHIDPWLTGLFLLIASMGLVVLYSASAQDMGLVMRQLVSFIIGFVVMLVMAQVPPKIYQAFSPWFYASGLVLLIGVMIFGEVRMGAQRWLDIPGFGSVQPSEFMKLAMPMMTAWFLSVRPLPPTFKAVVVTLMLIGIPVLLIAEQPDLGTSLLVMASGMFVLFLSGLRWWMIGACVGALAAIIPVAWMFLLHDYQRQRVLTLIDPEADALGTGWNIIQSKTAIGSGGVFGKGYLNGTQSHLHFLPEGHTDFIIAAFSEEFGLLGVAVLMTLYCCIIFRAFQIAFRSNHNYGRLLAGAIGLSFFVYVFVNAGMVSGILPVVGVPLPFMSYGGTAIITLMAGFGLLVSIQTHR
ncbi:rod shape-determining protein RodA [Alkanindiges hydrocarboniclasticus]|uniref:Peptidoglycan glycosyltransferase MrdB n=1 Tax=Alkanindiges hydrocarboniclasticus TaxID=1907941 RepID=A0A1S8CTU4_9GAMM|nr:rod shape-determining protein RodA [Alkanindiges hydrocarboniclasticus]ONG39849.1 rod shape-determining protein RodA [Alkanindiges hydrocarboniclasticus]